MSARPPATRVGRTPGVNAQDVTVLTFDQGGVLRNVRRLNEDDAMDVTVVTRATPSPGSEASFLQQLLGNVGKFSTGGTTRPVAANAGRQRCRDDAGQPLEHYSRANRLGKCSN